MNNDNLKNIGIIMGGYSHEYEISLKSGQVVYETLKNEYNCYRIYIKENNWNYIDKDNNLHPVDMSSFKIISYPNLNFDCIFNAIHGTPGEDGKMQKYFKDKNIPITGCNSDQSALTFDKIKCLDFLSSKGINVAPSISLTKSAELNFYEIEERIGFPCFIKASNSGSSFGVYKVYNKDEMAKCLDLAFKVDNKVLIESYIEGREFSIGVIKYDGNLKVLPITEIISSNDFFDYEAKYKGKAQEITPAKISLELESSLKLLSKEIYNLLDLRGFSRSEFIVNSSGIYYLETNTVPGLTSESILPQQAKCANIDLKDLFKNAIEEVIN
jgi:D-alanine-D-alanine ligase